jgi:sigma-E factor negative regulatory protein RseB
MTRRRAGFVHLLLSGFLSLFTVSSLAAEPLTQEHASAWLKRISEAARKVSYEGVFVMQHDGFMQTLAIANQPVGGAKKSRLAAMDGEEREIYCEQSGSISRITEGGKIKLEKRLNSRYFPDLLPSNAASLSAWYGVRLGERSRVAGQECRLVEILPKDEYRWGYVLCADKDTGLPLKAMMVNGTGQPLMQYAFAEIRIGQPGKPEARNNVKVQHGLRPQPLPAEAPRPIEQEAISVNNLPPGFARVSAVKRKLPNKPDEVEHWVFSDGLTHVSLFLEPALQPVESVRGQSKHGMINMAKRQVGNMQATVLGDAPWPAIEAIALGLEARGNGATR